MYQNVQTVKNYLDKEIVFHRCHYDFKKKKNKKDKNI